MTEQSIAVFDCDNPNAARLIGTFSMCGDGQARLRRVPLCAVKDPLDCLFALFTKGSGDDLISPNSDGTYFLSDFAPSGWGAKFVARQLVEAGQLVPKSSVGWLRQSTGFGSGRIVTCLENSQAPDLAAVDTRLSDLTPSLLDNFYRFVQFPGQQLDEDSLRLLRPGCDLGGVRPKALISYDGCEHIAKFGLPDDEFDVPLAEYATLRLAYLAGITVPSFELVEIGSRNVLLIERFDRTEAGARIHYLSAYSLLNPPLFEGNDSHYKAKHSYGGLAEALEPYESRCPGAGPELFRRMVFNIMVGNIDDHLRNHAVLLKNPGVIELSPAFDLCPQIEAPFRAQSIGVGALGRASTVSNALSQCSRFKLSQHEAITIVGQVKDVLSNWRRTFCEAGASARELRVLTPCFAIAGEHEAIAVNLQFGKSELT